MYKYVYKYMYVHMFCEHEYIYIYVYIYIYIYMQQRVGHHQVCASWCPPMYVYVHVWQPPMHVCACVYTHAGGQQQDSAVSGRARYGARAGSITTPTHSHMPASLHRSNVSPADVCVRVCIYVYMYTYIHIYLCVCVCVYIYIYIYTYIPMKPSTPPKR